MTRPDAPSRRSLGQRLVWAFAVGAVALLVALVVGGVALSAAIRSVDRQVDRLDPANGLQRDLLASLVNQETGVRGYALAGTRDFLEPYTTGRSDQKAIDVRLRQLLQGDPELIADLDRMESAAERWRTTFAEPLIAAIDRPTIGAIPLDPTAGRAPFDRIRADYERLKADVVAKRQDARKDLTANIRVLVILFSLGTFLLILGGVLAWVALRRWVVHPLDLLGTEVTKVSGGDLEHPLQVGGPAEIALLGTQVEEMRLRIVRELASVTAAERRVMAQARELQRSNDDLEQFAYVASHDLQEPLRKVASFCQLLERRYRDQLDERGEQYLAFAVDGAKRMQVLINDLLAFSRVGRSSAVLVPVSLDDALADATDALAVAIGESGARVTHDPLPTVLGDRGLLAQLLQNLVGNAIKFRGDRTPEVHLGVVDRGARWEVSCVDNGIGIEPAYAERIFVIFQRLHQKEEYAGTGIGLALCKRIVEHHGGEIWLDTTVSSGTAMRFSFPKDREDAHA